MDAEFWHARWRDDRIGFHQDRVTPMLMAHWPGLGVAPAARVFVPLCGKSLDLAWLASQGHDVLGVELSRKAVEAFFAEHRLDPHVDARADGLHYRAGAIEIVCGDAFALASSLLARCDAVFDRAALIALPADLRRRYADVLYRRLPTGCRGLLVTLEYPPHEASGPPFSVDEAEVRSLFGSDWRVARLERRDILAEQPGFAREGVTRLATAAYRLDRC